MKHDPRHTMLGIRIKRENKPWIMVMAYGVILAAFLLGIIKLSEKYGGSVEWP